MVTSRLTKDEALSPCRIKSLFYLVGRQRFEPWTNGLKIRFSMAQIKHEIQNNQKLSYDMAKCIFSGATQVLH